MPEVRAVKRACDILEILRKEKEPQSLAELHRKLDLSKTTLARILNTLEQQEYVERDNSLQKYTLGIKFMHYGYAVSEKLTIKQVSEPILKKIRDACSETVYIYMLYENRRICIDCLPGKSAVRVMVYLGQESPLYAGASGKVILAYFEEDELEKYFQETKLIPLTSSTITDRHTLEQDLKEIRENGYAISTAEKDEGVISASAPIWDQSNKVTASISIAAPVEKKSNMQDYIKLVTEGAREISSYNLISRKFIQ